MNYPTVVNLATLKVVTYLNGAFVGLPYGLREGQAPRDILDRYRDDWVWLGSPGWYCGMTADQMFLAKAYYQEHLIKTRWYEGAYDIIGKD